MGHDTLAQASSGWLARRFVHSPLHQRTRKNVTPLRFLIPSALGVLVFLTPIPWEGVTTIGIGLLTNWTKSLLGAYGLHAVLLLMVTTSVLTLMGSTFKSNWITRSDRLRELFVVSPIWLALRVVGTVFGLIYFLQIGPEVLRGEDIGGAVFVGIGVNVLAVYITACILLPLLTDYGLMEFVGTLAQPLFRRVFRLPGRAAIDSTTSFVGASAIGLMISIDQYNRGYYTAREACVIATNFSVVSLPFSLVVATVSGIEAYFLPWYGFVVLACLAAALITPRLPPLSRKAETYANPSQESANDSIQGSLVSRAWTRAVQRASSAPGVSGFFANGLSNLSFFLFSVVTSSLACATTASS